MFDIKDLSRVMFNLLFAVAQFFTPFVSVITGIGESIAERANPGITPPEMPAAYAFSIWFVIFALSIIYALHQAFPSQVENKLYKKIGYYSAGLFLASNLWMAIEQLQGDRWYLVVIIFAMLFFALKSFFIVFNEGKPSSFKSYILMPLFGLFSGWLSIAVFLNLTSFLREKFSFISTLSPTFYALFTIIPASILAFIVIFKTKGNLWYSGAISWGLLAIIISNLSLVHNAFITALAAGLILLVFIVVGYIKKSNL